MSARIIGNLFINIFFIGATGIGIGYAIDNLFPVANKLIAMGLVTQDAANTLNMLLWAFYASFFVIAFAMVLNAVVHARDTQSGEV
jgi:predicted lysophospholipase L1 biosynthesis ABC-type transport system permease subunit